MAVNYRPWLQVALETTSTETIVSMVEAGPGISIVPLPSGAVTRGRRLRAGDLEALIRPVIRSHFSQ